MVAIAAIASAAPADASARPASIQSGWWDLLQVGPVTAPSATPPDQLQVSYGITGPLSFAAIRFTVPQTVAGRRVDPSTVAAVVTLTIATDSKVGISDVAACPTTKPWKPGPDQPASQAPTYNCSGGVQSAGTVSQSGTAESWSLGPAQQQPGRPGQYELALVPAPGNSTPFSISYDDPTALSVTLTAPPPRATFSASPSTSSVTAVPPATVAAAPNLPPFGVSAGPIPAPAPAVAATPGSPTPQQAREPSSAVGHLPRWGLISDRGRRVMAVALLLAMVIALYFAASRPARPPRLLGSVGRHARSLQTVDS